jgi:hypothetical protein
MRMPEVSDAARDHLAGRPLVVRASPRHGCCGGRALVPVAEIGPPTDPDRYQLLDDGPVTCFVDPRLDTQPDAWRVELVGFGRWRRLHLTDSQGIDPTRCQEHPDA